RNHNDLTQALSIIDRIKPERAYLTHVGHSMDAWLENNEACLPAHVSITRDNWVVQGSD
ncbi:MAG: phosphonate metabolism protein PhnP, partial [Pseudomonadota bacterium]